MKARVIFLAMVILLSAVSQIGNVANAESQGPAAVMAGHQEAEPENRPENRPEATPEEKSETAPEKKSEPRLEDQPESLATGNWPKAVSSISSEPVAAEACLRQLDSAKCALNYGFRAIEIHAIGDEVIARFEGPSGIVDDADVIVLSSHLEDAALNERISLEEVSPIFAQFQKLAGARYEIPNTASEIKRSLGFAEDTPIASSDWLELLKVHIERTLSTTPAVSDLILDFLRVGESESITNAESNQVPTQLNPIVIEADRNSLAL